MAICKTCEKDLVKNMAEVRMSTRGNKRFTYRDENGRMWNGHNCPQCHLDRNKVALDPLSKRACRKCKKGLPKSRYFFHVTCAPKEFLETDEGEAYSTVGFGSHAVMRVVAWAGIPDAPGEEGGEE